jgi:hypothetical protein
LKYGVEYLTGQHAIKGYLTALYDKHFLEDDLLL